MPAIVEADAEFPINGSDGARENIKAAGLKIVYDKRYPPATTDFAPIVRTIQAANPDIVAIFYYPPDSVGFVCAVNEIGYKRKMIGCGIVGLQATAIKTQLGLLLKGATAKLLSDAERFTARSAGSVRNSPGELHHSARLAWCFAHCCG
jgi:branched-chain amino acid transport system substrate-binding protein